MKRLFSLLLAGLMLLSLFACTTDTTNNHSDKLKIIATIFPQYDFARTLGGNLCDVSMLVSPGTETHSFEPTTSDILELSDCDIFIYTGGESDSWIDSMLRNIQNPDMTVISLMDCVEVEEEHQDHNHSHTDEHVWTSPVNAITISEKICNVMCEKDSENAEIYRQNFEDYKEKLTDLDETFREITESSLRNTLVFGDRFPLKHFATEYNLDCYAAFSGCSDDTEASAATVATLIDKVKAENIPLILKIELSSDNIAATIQKETGAEIRTFYSCHNISKDDFENGETYLSLMEKNTETLRAALN
ncbi:MAG: zinc ABC transporter substrate-binding protein [Ruminococcaceae bacterium]|nr:zinc ABC transporter substrate-binding protein [Oscillospiraceae bacterium]